MFTDDVVVTVRSAYHLAADKTNLARLMFQHESAWFPGSHGKQFAYAYTTVPIFRKTGELSQAVLTILEAGTETGIYTTVFAMTVLREAWHTVQVLFYTSYLVDIVVVCCLMTFVEDSRNERYPSYFALLVLLALALVDGLSHCLEVGIQLRAMGRIFKSVWTFHEYFVTIYVVCASGFGLIFHPRVYGDSNSKSIRDLWPNHHPVWLAVLIFFKTNQVVIKTLAIRNVGEHVIPAYNALMSRAAGYFLLFVGMNFVNSFLTYYAVPVELYSGQDNDGPPIFNNTFVGSVPVKYWENVFTTLVYMFQLDFSGNFDLGDLDGENQQVTLTGNGDTFSGHIDNAPESKHWHHGVCILYVLWTLWIHIGLLNVFIGLLSQLYSEAFDRRKQNFEAFRAVYSYKMLMRLSFGYLDQLLNKRYWMKVWRDREKILEKAFSLFSDHETEVRREDHETEVKREKERESAVWIAYHLRPEDVIEAS